MKLAKNQANAKQHHETELFLFENYSLSSSTLSSKIIEHILILKNKQKNKRICIHEIMQLIIAEMKMKIKMKNRLHSDDIKHLGLDMDKDIVNINRGGCKGLPLLPMQHPEMADINFQS